MKEDKLEDLVKTLEASIQLIQSGLAGVRKVQLELAGLTVRGETVEQKRKDESS